MAQTKPSLGEGIWATTPVDTDTPTGGKVAGGWTVETPPFEWQNWWQNRSDEFLFHVNDFGMPQWDAATEYTTNSMVMSAGIMYRSLQASNTGQIPVSQPTFWVKTFGAESFSFLTDNYLTKAGNLSSVANKKLSRENIGIYVGLTAGSNLPTGMSLTNTSAGLYTLDFNKTLPSNPSVTATPLGSDRFINVSLISTTQCKFEIRNGAGTLSNDFFSFNVTET